MTTTTVVSGTVTLTAVDENDVSITVNYDSAATVQITEQTPFSVTVVDPGGNGPPGMSAYQIAVQAGYQGTAAQWLASLSGKTLELEYVAISDGAQPVTLPLPFGGVQAYFLNGLRERRSNFALTGNVVTTPDFMANGDQLVVVYYPS